MKFLNDKDWFDFNERFPRAFRFLIRRSIQNEYVYRLKKPDKNEFDLRRIEDIEWSINSELEIMSHSK